MLVVLWNFASQGRRKCGVGSLLAFCTTLTLVQLWLDEVKLRSNRLETLGNSLDRNLLHSLAHFF